ncbi:MAG: phosphatidate cytidylyltransferase [Candidatus Eisenbacteria sp.]|nr:phosphatidate cytidylyltransferase [Candidatus Eisenbacteria bacterium]
MRWFGEMWRKGVHLSAILIPLGYYFTSEKTGRRILISLCGIVFLIDVIRLNQPRIRTFFFIFFGRLVRDHERYNLLGATYLMLSSLICAYAFEKPIAVAAIAFLILGDSAAALVGKSIGRIRVFGKTLEGSLACFAVCMATGWVIRLGGQLQQNAGLDLTMIQIVGGAVMATLIELLPVPLDDNIRIPLAAGFTMTLLQ